MPPTNNGRAKNLSEQLILRSGTCVFQASRNGASWHRDKKNGIPLYPNLVNLKSNTMKNTMQRYGLFRKKQDLHQEKYTHERNFNTKHSIIAHSAIICALFTSPKIQHHTCSQPPGQPHSTERPKANLLLINNKKHSHFTPENLHSLI